MTAAMVLVFLGGLTFTEEEIAGLHVGAVLPCSGAPTLHFRHADLDGDGAPDLVLSDAVLFQRNKSYPPEARTALPALKGKALLDVWGDALYVRLPASLRVLTWSEGAWRTVHEQAIEWPAADVRPSGQPVPFAPDQRFRLYRFLYDFDNDDQPEIVALGEPGVFVYAEEGEDYGILPRWDVLPPRTLKPSRQTLWPPEDRAIALPAQSRSFTLTIDQGGIEIVEPLWEAKQTRRYRYRHYDIAEVPEGSVQPVLAKQRAFGGVPRHVRPCRLNQDGRIDFAGRRWVRSNVSVLRLPILETWASIDGGVTFHRERALGFDGASPRSSFVDYDNDGDLDMVVERMTLFDSGIRESVNQFLTRSAVDHVVSVYLQHASGFAERPAVEKRLTITLEAPPVQRGVQFRRDLAGDVIDLTGDLDGDGRRDLVVRDESDHLSVYLGRDERFAERPSAKIRLFSSGRMAVADVDGDGRSDIVVHPPRNEGAEAPTLVYFSREEAP